MQEVVLQKLTLGKILDEKQVENHGQFDVVNLQLLKRTRSIRNCKDRVVLSVSMSIHTLEVMSNLFPCSEPKNVFLKRRHMQLLRKTFVKPLPYHCCLTLYYTNNYLSSRS